jgi:hypothetical protein
MLFASPWEIESESSGGDHKHWDYKVDLTCTCTVSLENPDQLKEHCGLSDDVTLTLFGEWGTNLTNHVRSQGPRKHVSLDQNTSIEEELAVPVDGSKTGGTLILRRYAVIESPPDRKAAGPSRPGSVIWEDTKRIPLERPGSRLPVNIVNFEDFSHRFGDEDAVWEIEISTNAFELPISRAVRVYINSKHEQLVEMITRGESGYESKLTSQMLYYEIGRHLLSRALRDNTFCDPEHEYEEGTLGASIRLRLDNLFPHLSLPEVRNTYDKNPGKFESTLQGNFLELP